jgi:glycosyltransferase involved in cell wall biosynthesis
MTALRLVLLSLALGALLGAGLISGLSEPARAWLLTGGFVLLVPVVALSPRRALAPLAVAVVFVLYGGVSALVAVPESAAQQARHAKGLSKDQVEASQRSPRFEATHSQEERAFKRASLLTGLAGLVAIAAASLAAGTAGARGGARRLGRRAGAGRMEMAGRSLVFVAFLGVAAALARFFLTQIPTDDLHMAIKSFWNGGSYFLLVATFAIPGFGLWLQGVLHRSHSRGDLIRVGAWAAVYLALLVPTGQRGFAIALAVMVVVILAFDGILEARHLVAVAIAGVVLLGVTQAARNEVREEGGLSPSGYVARLAPAEWKSLYASQLASFNWTVQVIEFEDKLDIPNPLPQLLLKPVPRQIDPNKSQGFGAEFTRAVYPGAARQEVSFAIPLIAESYYGFGILGLIVAMALLGAGAGLAESRLAARDPMAMPLVLATMGWCLFVLVRGDLANALVFASGWVIPLLLVSRSIGLRRDAKPERVVVDALQVAPEFSGIGRRVAEIGRGLREEGCPLPLTVRCAADVANRLRDDFPAGTAFHTPLRSSRPRVLRILYQQLMAPLRDAASTVLVCPGDQAPVWGRAQLVFVVHDVRRLTHPETSGGRVEAAYYKATMTFGARRARRIVTISAFSLAEIERTLAPTCPIAVVSAHPAPRAPRTAPPDGELTLLTVGALRGYKGIETLIEALSMLGADAPRPRVICVGAEEGGGGYRETLAARARELGVERSFELTGWLPDERLRDLYASCAGTVNPSTYEGYGLPVAESLADGLPTIASDIPPHREIAADAALYFQPGDAAALAGALDRLRRDPELREGLARRAAARAHELAGGGGGWAEALLVEVGGPAGARDGDLALAASR